MPQTKKQPPFLPRLLLVILVLAALAVYFRTYPVHGGFLLGYRSSEAIARDMVDRPLRERVAKNLERELARLPAPERERVLDIQVARLKQQDGASYEKTVRRMAEDITALRRENKRAKFLLEADPYHYLYQTEQLLKTGRTGDLKKAGQIHQPLMRAPYGHWEPFLLHPYVGAAFYTALKGLSPRITVTEAVAYLPLVLTVLILLVFAVFARVMEWSLGGTVFGMITLVLSPIFIQRSAIGWYDTDPYNYLFPLGILVCLFVALKDSKKLLSGAVTASFLTGLYALFWTGWPFILILSSCGLLGSALILTLLKWPKPPRIAISALKLLGFYGAGSFCFLSVFMTPAGFAGSIRDNWSVLNQFSLSQPDIWPNVFLTVGEAGGITFMKLIFLAGNYVTFVFAILGIGLEIRRVFSKNDVYGQFRMLFLSLFSIPLLVMSLRTERLTVLFVLSLAIFVSFSFSGLLGLSQELRGRITGLLPLKKYLLARRTVAGVIGVLFLSPALLMAHVVAHGIKPIMDGVWYEALQEIRQRTPEDAIVNSWWPPGYFITALANRRVTMDGGTQNFHATYWIAKALFSPEERESAGLFRMVNLSGDSAAEFLLKLGMDTPDAVDLILKIVKQERSAALAELPPFMTGKQKNELLDMTHGEGVLPPSYVLVYDDLITQNLAASTFAKWDFRKARALQAQKKEGSSGIGPLSRENASSRYVQELLQVSGQFLKYQPASPLERKQGDVLVFGNGALVNWPIKDAVISIPSKGLSGRPVSLFYLEEGQLVEKVFEGDRVNASLLVFEDSGLMYSVIADAELIRSLLFRLYYLNGSGLSFFKPLLGKGSLSGGTCIRVFELDRTRFKP